MINVAVCDDDIKLCINIYDLIMDYAKKEHKRIYVDLFYSGNELLSNIKSGKYYNILFLDIELGDLTFGSDIGNYLRDEMNNQTTSIVYISSYTEYANRLFASRPLDFIEKPITESKIYKIFEVKLHIRIPCPDCKCMEKKSINTQYVEIKDDVLIRSQCCSHGGFFTTVRTADFIDFNAQLRDLIKGLHIKKEWENKKNFIVMCDGGDWSGVWDLRIHCEAMNLLGYQYNTPRLFCPVITDWSGAKFSKSLYVENNAYAYLPIGFKDYNEFISIYGYEGLVVLYNEIASWVKSPNKFFRNYSIEYIENILK